MKELEPLLIKLKSIDMFIHDSDHSYEPMMFEYATAWNYMKNGGILASDDINHSNAFAEFTKQYANQILNLTEFEEISRNTDTQFKRPWVGYFFKNI